eukprot:CAMPEP_0179127304 /NCGR_PEP_ID=MMETSP0796-20121207/60302_1 /TAXON_ID=73915 /ORGANISM="Pyrodinium bahamense, Strain pbaha01" /LENGTH=46 /DNA_ID= /DNA_START= /DNA_END= /DNA_ORIENTATION=
MHHSPTGSMSGLQHVCEQVMSSIVHVFLHAQPLYVMRVAEFELEPP